MLLWTLPLLLLLWIVLLCRGLGFWAFAITGFAAFGSAALAGVSPPWLVGAAVPLTVVALIVGVPALRRTMLSRSIMQLLGHAMPSMSETERVALEAGTVWWDAEIFCGNPDWQRLLEFQSPKLSAKEREFVAGPVAELCALLDDWEITQSGQLPPEVWDHVRQHRYFGMIIPEEYGGHGFSALAHSAVITKVASRSVAAAVTVMVPNSLGPAELLLHYGTEEQKQHYLPRLARGEEVPCFALTEPQAGSDAASIRSEGVVCHGEDQGKEVLGIRLNWNKRYITLAPIATVLGLAFRLRDPDHLLGDVDDLGITCALIPPHLPGVEIGRRHDPLGVAFLNGPTTGRDVFVPLDAIIGGRAMAGQGWMMLMQCLAAGRSISLPALAVGAAQLASRVVGAYGNVREQFNLNIGAFEGVEERIGRIAGLTYLMNATRVLTAGAVDQGQKPAVISAIVKAYLTEHMRTVINDAMDVQGGAAICRGPRNLLAGAYAAIPVGITVEGANILTRTLIIYGQGALRCHPHIHEQMEALAANDLARFDRAFSGHVRFVLENAARAFLMGMGVGPLVSAPPAHGLAKKYFLRLSRLSAAFATLSDAAMGMLGASLKRREKLSGRFADALAWMYLGSATLKHFTDASQPKDEEPFCEWACEHACFEIQTALLGILENLPSGPASRILRFICFPWGARYRPPCDRLGARVARALLGDRAVRNRLTADIYIPGPDDPGLGRLERALGKVEAAHRVMNKIREAVRAGKLAKKPRETLVERALGAHIIDRDESALLADADAARLEAIQVDAFDPELAEELHTSG